MTISFQQASDLLYQLWQGRGKMPLPTTFLVGPPGIGKTAIAREVHQRMGPAALLEVRDLTSIPPEDLSGLPFRSEGRTRYEPQEWLWRLCQPGVSGVLVLDDLPAAGPAQAAGCRQLALDRKIGTHTLSPDVLLVVTGNRREDKARASTLPSHFLNSVMVLEVDPDFKEWVRWFSQQGGDPLIPAFLSRRDAMFSALPVEADKNGCFPTPRTWTMLSNVLSTAKAVGCLPQTACGYVGEGSAREFIAFLREAEGLPDPEETLENPQRAVPHPKDIRDVPDRVLALLSGVCTLTAREITRIREREDAPIRASQDHEAKQKAHQMLTAIKWVVGDRSDLLANAISVYKVAGGNPDVLLVTIKETDLSDLRAEIKEALR